MPVGYDSRAGVAVITLDRPEVLNAFNDDLGRDALEAVMRASDDPETRCVVITGAGRAFCSGEDLGALSATYDSGIAPELGRILRDRYNPLIRAIRAAPKPVVAAINGVAAGAGASLALACDFRIASERAKLVLAFIKVGLVPDSGAVWFLTRMVGSARAWQLAASGDPIDSEQALALGLVTRIAPAKDFEQSWRSFAETLAQGPTSALALTKSLVTASTTMSLEEQLELEIDAQSQAGSSDDHMEGVRAFLGKRPAHFTGR